MKLPPRGSQNRSILEYLIYQGELSSLDAIKELGVLRLPNRISELRKKYGVKIAQKTVRHPVRPKVHWNVYWLENEEIERWSKLLAS